METQIASSSHMVLRISLNRSNMLKRYFWKEKQMPVYKEFLYSDLQTCLLVLTKIQYEHSVIVDVVVDAPVVATGVGKSFHESEKGSMDQEVCQNEVTFLWTIFNRKGN